MTINELAEEITNIIGDILVEEIPDYEKTLLCWGIAPKITKEIIQLYDQYHEAKMKEITDADIKAWAEKKYEDWINDRNFDGWIGSDLFIAGAKAILNSEIKHIE